MEHLKVETTAFAITLSCQVVLFKKCNMEKKELNCLITYGLWMPSTPSQLYVYLTKDEKSKQIGT